MTNQELAKKIAQRLIRKSSRKGETILSVSLALPISGLPEGERWSQLVNLMGDFKDVEEMDYWADVIGEGVARAVLEVLDNLPS